MKRWEYEIVEFKEAKSSYDTDKIGRYFSAISNEANLRQQQYGWLVFGIGEEQKTKVKKIVGTAYKKGDNSLLERFKYEISRDTANGMTFGCHDGRAVLAKIKLMINGKITHAGNSLYQRSGQGFCKGKEFDLQIYAKSIDVVSDGNRAI